MRTRSATRVAKVTVPSIGTRTFPRAVIVSPAELDDLREIACRGHPIFNPDSKRVQNNLSADSAVTSRLLEFLQSEQLVEGRQIGPAVALHSHAGCERQPWHTDYDPECVRRCAAKPMGVILALQDHTRVLLRDEEVTLCAGDVFVFDGDVVHAGAAYDEPNTRIHVYLDSPGVRRPKNETYLVR